MASGCDTVTRIFSNMAKTSDQSDKDAALDPALPQKKRARRRLVGAAALCLAAAIALPVIFDHEPHRGNEDVKVQIPSRDTPPAADHPRANGEIRQESRPDARADARVESKAEPKVEPKVERKAEPRADAKPEPKAEAKAEAKAETKPEAKTEAKAARRDGKADGKPPTADTGRFVLQIGAFSTEKGAADQMEKVKAAGLAAFTEKVRTQQGERIRVRVGPFASRDKAEQARGQLKLAGIDSALIAP